MKLDIEKTFYGHEAEAKLKLFHRQMMELDSKILIIASPSDFFQ